MWNEEIECMSREDIFELQLKKLQSTVKRAFDNIPFYTEKYTNANVLRDCWPTTIPFTNSADPSQAMNSSG